MIEGKNGDAQLFDPLSLRGARLRNRIVVSPMCQYSAIDGVPQAWHLVHLGSRAVGGAGLVLAEATAISARGRISPADTGIWNDTQAATWAPIAKFIAQQGAVAGIQLAHAGRKAGTAVPWLGGKPLAVGDAWVTQAPSAIAFDADHAVPEALDAPAIAAVVNAFTDAAVRACETGFGLIEIHAAHGYLLHEFLSPLSNHREDAYGGSFDNRIRLVCEVVDGVRGVIPDRTPLLLRISASDWFAGGWDIEQSVALARVVKMRGVDAIDVSSGGNVPGVRIPVAPGYQVPFAERIRREAEILTGAVGLIEDPHQAQAIVASGKADFVLLAREMLRDPYWPRRAAVVLGVDIEAPKQYRRAW